MSDAKHIFVSGGPLHANLPEYEVRKSQIEMTKAVEKSNVVTGGGFLLSKNHESLIRIVGRATTLEEVAGQKLPPQARVRLAMHINEPFVAPLGMVPGTHP